MPALTARDVEFLRLQTTVLCVECELISYNNTDHCLACGSRAVLSLSRLLGGSLQSGRVAEEVLERAVAEVLTGTHALVPRLEQSIGNVGLAFQNVVEQACTHTAAEGAALALYGDGKITCVARAGAVAPDIGAEVDVERGLTGLSLRTGRTVCCDDTQLDRRADARQCRELGVQSVVAAPVAHLESVVGVLEVLSAEPGRFDDTQVAKVQLLASLVMLGLVQAAQGGYRLTGERR